MWYQNLHIQEHLAIAPFYVIDFEETSGAVIHFHVSDQIRKWIVYLLINIQNIVAKDSFPLAFNLIAIIDPSSRWILVSKSISFQIRFLTIKMSKLDFKTPTV